MKVVKKTADYTVYQKRSERYAVQNPDKAWINGDEKIHILLAEGLIKTTVPKPAEPEPAAEEAAPDTEEAAAEDSAEAAEVEKEAEPEPEPEKEAEAKAEEDPAPAEDAEKGE